MKGIFVDNFQPLVLLATSLLVGLIAHTVVHHLPVFLARKWRIKRFRLRRVSPICCFTLSICCALIVSSEHNSLLHSLLLMLAATALIALTIIDWQYQWLPDCLTLPLLWCGLAVNLFALFAPLQEAVLGAIFGYLALWCVDQGYRLIRNKPGIGHGDFKLLAALGAWGGWSVLPIILLLAASLALLCYLFSPTRENHWQYSTLAFGSYLAVTGWLVLALRDVLPLPY